MVEPDIDTVPDKCTDCGCEYYYSYDSEDKENKSIQYYMCGNCGKKSGKMVFKK